MTTYIVRFERAVYGGEHGTVIGTDCVVAKYATLQEAREAYDSYEVQDIGELLYLDMISGEDEEQENLDCRGRIEEEEEEESQRADKEFDSDAMDNVLNKDGLDWTFEKPKDGAKYSIIYIIDKEEEKIRKKNDVKFAIEMPTTKTTGIVVRVLSVQK